MRESSIWGKAKKEKRKIITLQPKKKGIKIQQHIRVS